MATRDELHQLIDTLPDGLVGEVLDFVQFVAKKARQRDLEAWDEESRAWEEAALLDLSDRLAEWESDVPPEELESWKSAFLKGAAPAKYVPGKGLVTE